MPVSEAQKRATAKYEKENYDKVLVRFPKGTKERMQSTGVKSINSYIIKCVLDSLDNAQNAKTDPKNQVVKENTPSQEKAVNNPIKCDKTEAEKIAELQAIIDQKRVDEAERKRKIEERKALEEKERQEEFQNMVNGVINDLRSRKEQKREEDRKKYKDMPDGVMQDLLQDKAFCEWLEKIGFDNALEPLAEEIGINNAERVIKVAKERRRKESIEKD